MTDFDLRKLSERKGSEEHRKWLRKWVLGRLDESSPEEVAQELAEKIDRLEQERIRDALTGAFNRGFMGVVLGLELVRYGQRGNNVGVIMLDIDKFKSINDQEPDGHAAGDRALVNFSKLLKEITGDLAVVGRWGGEEFIVVLPYATPESLKEIAVDIGETTSGWLAKRANLVRPRVTVSIGACIAGANESVVNVMARVDKLMYQAKEQGRSRLVYERAEEKIEVVKFE